MRTDERGAAAVELALLMPLVVLLFSVTVGGARLWQLRAGVDHAAAASARAASLARSSADAVADGSSVATAQLQNAIPRCVDPVVEIDARQVDTSAGTPAAVTVTVTCSLSLGDLVIPGWPSQVTVTGVATSPVDRYRERK